MREIFLGKPSHWALWVVVAVVLFLANRVHMHVRWFNEFQLMLLGLSAAIVAFLLATYRPGERITREPFDDA